MIQPTIAIFTKENDLHALAVEDALKRDFPKAMCHIVEVNRLSGRPGIVWSLDASSTPVTIPTRDGVIDIREIDAIWWRRVNSTQKIIDSITKASDRDLIDNDCRAALLGVVLTSFSGQWISHPQATSFSENKIVQLQAARNAGLPLPRTLISHDPNEIRRFVQELNYQVVVKPVKGSHGTPLLAARVTAEHLDNDASLSLCPSIYQEYIPGNKHLRIMCFGDSLHSVLVESDFIDWRQDFDIPTAQFNLPKATESGIKKVLKILGLRMGVVDMKLGPDETPYWLEVNPQGQFLFAEALSGIKLAGLCAEFLHSEALKGRLPS